MAKNNFNWDEIKEQLQNAVKLEQNNNDLTVKIIILEANVEENKMVGDILKGKEEMKHSFGQFLGLNGPLDCEIIINHDENNVMLKMKNKEDYEKVFNLLKDMFSGDFFKNMLDAMMGAFKGLGDPEDIFGKYL